MICYAPLYHHIPTGNGSGHQIGAGFNSIGDHPMPCPMKLLHPFNCNGVRSHSMDFCTSLGQEGTQVCDFRFPCNIMQTRGPLRQASRHDQVFRARDCREIQVNPCPFKTTRFRMDISMLHLNFRPHHLQSFKVKVHRSGADRTSTRQRNLGLSQPSE